MRRPATEFRHLVPTSVALVLALLHSAGVSAQGLQGAAAPEQAPIRLKISPLLQDSLTPQQRKEQPVFVFGDRLSGRSDLDTTVQGHAELRHADTVIRAERLDYYQPEDRARARGNVRLNRAGNVYEGPLLELKVDSFEGFFNEPNYRFMRNDAYGKADRVDFIDEKRSVARNASYSTCQRRPGPSWLPDWILNASSIKFDYEEDVAEAEDMVLRFKDLPILSIPAMSFPLSDKRKSGFLPTTLIVDSLSGIDVIQPYYWNIAPNRDLTLYPELMLRRGVNLGADFRYLEPAYRGNARVDVMPSDSLRSMTRWGLTQSHSGVIDTGISGIGGLGAGLSLNRVSDDNYWRDFPRANTSLTQRLLASNGALSWGSGYFTTSLRATKYQTLQDVTVPITPPYDRLPQLTGTYARSNVNGFDYSVTADFTRFQGVPGLTLQPYANRGYTLAQVSYPWKTPGWYVTPKLQLHSTRYQFDGPLVNGATSASRSLPTFSLDSGLVLERPISYFGREFTQTLEPRAFYVYTPFRDQSRLPIYDSGATDFNFATVFTENGFGGNDRISDNNLVTLGATTRLLDPITGAEAARFGIAQRLRFRGQQVTLPGGIPDSPRVSDILVGAGVNWNRQWAFNSTVQYNPTLGRSERASVSARYNPTNYRVVSLAYNYQAGDFTQVASATPGVTTLVQGAATTNQIDAGWQWPLDDLWRRAPDQLTQPGQGLGEGRWYSVGRLNYSASDRKLVDAILGFEYDAGCWVGRVVFDRLQRAGQTASSRLLFQLEFVGFSRLGSNPLQTLKNNIPRYQFLREQTTTPSRFSNYE